MTGHDDDMIRRAVHELVHAAPAPQPIQGRGPEGSRRWLTVAAAGCVGVAGLVMLWALTGESSLVTSDTTSPTVLDTRPPPDTASPPSSVVEPDTATTEPTSPPNTSTTTMLSPAISAASTLPPTTSVGSANSLVVRRDGCPTLHFDSLPEGWGDEVEPVETEGLESTQARLVAPGGHVTITIGDLGDIGIAQTGIIDGYRVLETSDEDGEIRRILVYRPECEGIELEFVGVPESDIDDAIAAVRIDDRELTDADAPPTFIDQVSIFGRGFYERVDADPFVAAVSGRYGPTDSDTGWMPIPADFPCDDFDEYRSVFWGDLRVVFERSGREERITAWSIGDQSQDLFAPFDSFQPVDSLGLRSIEGLEVGAHVSVLDQFELVFEHDDDRFQIGGHIRVSARNESLTGIVVNRPDCV